MDLALKELWRAKLRFGLLTGAVSLLVFLLLFLVTLSQNLVGALIGAIRELDADVLVYDDAARRNLLGSRVDPALVDRVAEVDGVAEAAGLGVVPTTFLVGGAEVDATVFGVDPDGPGAPGRLVEGRLPGAGEIVVDRADAVSGLELGATVTTEAGGRSYRVVGVVEDSQLNAGATAYTPLPEYEALVRARNPAAPVVPLNAVAVRADGVPADVLAQRITDDVDGAEALARDVAASSAPGQDSVTQSFGLISGITFVVVVLLLGFFFLILTVQKLPTFTALRAVGAPTRFLGWSVVLQVAVVAGVAVAVAAGLLALALRADATGLAPAFDPRLVGTIAAVVLAASVLTGVASVRRITRLDPADAVTLR